MNKNIPFIAVGVFVLLFLSACGVQTNNEVYTFPTSSGEQFSAQTFESNDQYLAFVREFSTPDYYGSNYLYKGGVAMDVAISAVAPSAAVAESDGSGSARAPSYSGTNVQEVGIDEMDIIKTDGTYIYTISKGQLFTILAYPADEAKILSRIPLSDNLNMNGLFIEKTDEGKDVLVAFGSSYNYGRFWSRNDKTKSFVYVYDMSDKESPKMIHNITVDGYSVDARLKDGIVYFITNLAPTVEYPYPIMMRDGVQTSMPVDKIAFFPVPYQSPSLISVHSINVRDEALPMETTSIVVDASQTHYMSDNNIYFTYTEYVNEWEIEQKIREDLAQKYLTENDTALIEKINGISSDILNTYEKKQKVLQVIEEGLATLSEDEYDEFVDDIDAKLKSELDKFDERQYTVINRLSIDGMTVTSEANGKVPGSLTNQFALSEKDGYLRVATTMQSVWDRWSQQSSEMSNSVYVLDEDLKIQGSLTGLAPNENIYSTRFIDDRLYMVTFRQMDPFFVIDLSNPQSPQVLGELKIPGFSRYLHPYDENTVIGIGQDASDTGRVKGLKISLFDVTDVENPVEIAKYTDKDQSAYSQAFWEHKAFLFDKDKELLVIPAQNYDYEDPSDSYNGALVFKINKDEIKLRGLIDHSTGMDSYYFWGSSVERSLYIEDALYTKSQALIRINAIDDLHSVLNITLPDKSGELLKY
ncbi:MAG TPA: beta-propeller domain-containing protein [Acidobacteriota bacterium]|nr:beta-propeller domain-containing protein [Acidobacteriota bacterium]